MQILAEGTGNIFALFFCYFLSLELDRDSSDSEVAFLCWEAAAGD